MPPLADSPPALAGGSDNSAQVQNRSRLGMQLGETQWLLHLADVSEVIPVPDLLPVPLTKPWFAGVVNVRGNLISVVDLAAFLGGPPVTANERTRLVLVAERHRINSGLLFSRVVGLRQFDVFVRQPDEAQQAPWVEGCYLDQQQQRWSALNMHALVTHRDFLQVEVQVQ